jgi:hypothetical protein
VPLNQEMMNISPKGMVAKEEGNLLDIKWSNKGKKLASSYTKLVENNFLENDFENIWDVHL